MARAVLPSPPAARVDAPAMWHVTVPWLASRPQSPASVASSRQGAALSKELAAAAGPLTPPCALRSARPTGSDTCPLLRHCHPPAGRRGGSRGGVGVGPSGARQGRAQEGPLGRPQDGGFTPSSHGLSVRRPGRFRAPGFQRPAAGALTRSRQHGPDKP